MTDKKIKTTSLTASGLFFDLLTAHSSQLYIGIQLITPRVVAMVVSTAMISLRISFQLMGITICQLSICPQAYASGVIRL